MKYDVVIIGGGLAGLSLSIDLVRRGLQVLVIEKGTYPRHKVCGEYVSMESHAYLHLICPELHSLELPYITKFHLSSTRRKDFKTHLDLGGFGVSRYVLEEMLWREATKIGVVFKLKSKAIKISQAGDVDFTIKTSSETFYARLVCNSTGRKSNVESKGKDTQKLGTNYIGVKYHVKLKRDSGFVEIHNFPGGYCGINSLEEEKSCICYIVNANKLKASASSIEEMENRFLFQNRFIKESFEASEFLYKNPLTISGINFNIKESVSHESFFLGDSAGRIAPVTGNGMSMALRSASVLAQKIDLYFNNTITRSQLGTEYGDFWDKEFATRVRLSRYFQKLSEYPILSNFSIGVFNVLPKLASPIIKSTHGKSF